MGSAQTRSQRSNRAAERCGESGVATILGAVFAAVLVVVAMGAGAVGSAVVARHRAQAAADLAALAAAGAVPAAAGAACRHAAGVAHAMSTTLSGCRVDELDVVVTVDVVVRVGRLGLGTARAGARAGPVEPVQ